MQSTAYKNQFNRENYDQVSLMLPKGTKFKWKAEAKRRNLSLNAFIQEAVQNYIQAE